MTKTDQQQQAQDVMVTGVVSVQADDCLNDALDKMVEQRVSCLPVIDRRGRCIGILSLTRLVDLARGLEQKLTSLAQCVELPPSLFIEELSQPGFGDRKVEELMTSTVVAVGPEATLAEAARIMLDRQVHRLVVLGPHKKLLGLISTMDLLHAFVAGAPV